MGHEPGSPSAQRPGVVRGDVGDAADEEARVAAGPFDHGERRAQASRKDVRLDPVGASTLRLIGAVRERDRLQAHLPARHEGLVAGLEERLEVLGAHSLQHLDRNDRVVRAVDLAVVAQLDVDKIL